MPSLRFEDTAAFSLVVQRNGLEIANEPRVTGGSLEAHNFLDVRNRAQTSWQAKHAHFHIVRLGGCYVTIHVPHCFHYKLFNFPLDLLF